MKLTFGDERVLAVMAHPDDAELLCAGTLARARADGAPIGIVVMCRGNKGVGSATEPVDLDIVRREEAAAAANILGAELFWFGAGDGELFDTHENRMRLVEMLRRFRPTLVLTHAGEDYHADHRAASELAEVASWRAASRGEVTETGPLGTQPKLWFADTVNMLAFVPDIFIDVSQHVEMKRRMLECHQTQLARGKDADFTPLVEQMARQSTARGAQTGVAAAEAFRWHVAFKRVGAF